MRDGAHHVYVMLDVTSAAPARKSAPVQPTDSLGKQALAIIQAQLHARPPRRG